MNATANPPRRPAQRLAGFIFLAIAALFLAYAFLSIDRGAALIQKRTELSAYLFGWLTSAQFFFGDDSLRHMVGWYEQASVRMVLHMTFGGVALGFGALQFIPAIRRGFPRFHRACGLVVWLAIVASATGAIGFLIFVPMQKGSSGPAFHLSLWALGLLTVFLLWQAISAVLRRDFRSHMVWMALVYAALATAPVTRAGWVMFTTLGATAGQQAVNLAAGSFVLLQTIVGMALWLSFIGDADLPARAAAPSAWPRWTLATLCAASAIVAVYEGLLAPAGFGWPGGLRDARDMLPAGAGALWAVSSVIAMGMLPSAWKSAHEGARPSLPLTLAVAAVAAGALLIGYGHVHDSIARYSTRAFWFGYGACVLVSLLLAHSIRPNSLGRNAWGISLLASLWMPGQAAGAFFVGLMLGADVSEAMLAALVTSAGTMLVIGTATGFGARLGLHRPVTFAVVRNTPSRARPREAA